jgi:hypothetical protein
VNRASSRLEQGLTEMDYDDGDFRSAGLFRSIFSIHSARSSHRLSGRESETGSLPSALIPPSTSWCFDFDCRSCGFGWSVQPVPESAEPMMGAIVDSFDVAKQVA